MICPCDFHQEEIRVDGHCKCALFVGDSFDAQEAYRAQNTSGSAAASRSLRVREVTAYLTSWCPHSRRAKAMMANRDVSFQETDIEQDPSAARQLEVWNRGFRSTPTIVVRLVLTEAPTNELQNVMLASGATIVSCIAYVTRWCSQSRRTLNWLQENRVEAEVVDIDQDAEGSRRVQAWNQGNLSVPTLDVTLRLTEPSNIQLERALDLAMS